MTQKKVVELPRQNVSRGQSKPNDFGLFDMHGNAWEWCQEVYHAAYTTDVAVEDLTVKNQHSRVLRGGSFFNDAVNVRSAYRGNNYPDYRKAQHRFPCGEDLQLIPFTSLPQ